MAFRRSIYVVRDIGAGEPFTDKNVRIIRPGYGLAPRELPKILGRKARHALHARHRADAGMRSNEDCRDHPGPHGLDTAARQGARRLAGKPVLAWVVRAARAALGVDDVCVATSTAAADDAIAAWCKSNGVFVPSGG